MIIRRLIFEVAYGFVILIVAGLIGFFAVYAFGTPDVSTLSSLPLAQTSYLYDRSGTHVLYALHGEENRTVVSHDGIPDVMRQATVASEDGNFYEHHGVDFGGMIRALFEDIQAGKIVQGGSTITQQLARNVFYNRDRTFKRKLLETVMAIKIEQAFSKDEILDMYLNRVPYGTNAYGVEMAAQTYFGKPAIDLSVDESAFLASLTKAPSLYSPYVATHSDMTSQKNTVVRLMYQLDFISHDQEQQALVADIASKVVPQSDQIQAPHFVFYVLDQLNRQYGREILDRGGWKIYTTLDWDLQQTAERVVSEGAKKNVLFGASNAALTAIDPKTGEIRAMVGSKDFFDTSIDGEVNVTVRPRQPGSSFKPIAYATAFEKGFQPETILTDKPIDFGPDGTGKDYIPQNYDGQYHGTMPMRSALAESLNIPAVQTLYLAGIGPTVDMAHRLGITTLNDLNRYGLALVLGGGEVKLLDMVSSFGVFAREGERIQARGITRIFDQSGKKIGPDDPASAKNVLDPEVARKMNSILSDNMARSPIFGSRSPLTLPDRPVAAKTGTTQDFRDAWTIGYTPSLVVGVWVGNNDNHPMKGGADGVFVAAPIWHDFMVAATKGTPVENFAAYTPVTSDKLLLTGTREDSPALYFDINSGKKLSEKKASKKDPSQVRVSMADAEHSILYYVNKNDPLGTTPPDLSDPMLARWESVPESGNP